MIRFLQIAVLAGAVFSASVSAPFLRPVVAGDANGDQAVNVLDIQHAVAQLVEEGVAHHGVDTNRDGQVDTVDLQRIIQKAQEGEGEAPEKLPEPEDQAYVLARVEMAAARDSFYCPLKSAAFLLGMQASREPAPARQDLDTVPRTERHFYCLTPNAPPPQA